MSVWWPYASHYGNRETSVRRQATEPHLKGGGIYRTRWWGQSVPYCELFGGRFHYRPRQSRPSCQPRGFLAIPRPATRRPHLLNGAAPGRSRIATGSALRATVVFRRFARLGLAACANEWHLNAAPHILRELYRQLQARSSPPGVHDTRATARATGHGSKDTATAQRPSSPTSGALPARGQHAQSPWKRATGRGFPACGQNQQSTPTPTSEPVREPPHEPTPTPRGTVTGLALSNTGPGLLQITWDAAGLEPTDMTMTR